MNEGKPVEIKVLLSPLAYKFIVARAALEGYENVEDFTRLCLMDSIIEFTERRDSDLDIRRMFADPREKEA